jgi:hypothetical protein
MEQPSLNEELATSTERVLIKENAHVLREAGRQRILELNTQISP